MAWKFPRVSDNPSLSKRTRLGILDGVSGGGGATTTTTTTTAAPVATPPSGNLFAAYLAGEGITKDGSDAVSVWADDTGNGHDISQGTGTKQPLWEAAQVNGYPSVRFDGIDDFLKASSFASEANGTVLAIVEKLSTHTGCIFDGHTNSSQTLYFDSGAVRRIRTYAGGYGPWTNTGPEVNVWYAVVARFQASSLARLVAYNLESDIETSDGLANIPSPSFTGITVGTQGAGSAFPLDARIAELLVYNEASADAKIEDMITYARSKFIP